ncbi:MAG: CpsD/CapB family tyrosine-protein kinase [Clostridia bacterium]|nr:CpsD/CapB family tyrosine-protein kinase [Clostridia bacterium]
MKKEVITYKEPKSPISEIFRNLRTSVQFANTKRGLHTLLVTSTNPGEGKSWVSVNLAVTFAQAGKKVILVDCDMRKGRQFSIFDVAPTPGLSNYLSGVTSDGEESSDSILSYIKETPVENLFVIPAGNVPPNPSELLVSDSMGQAIDDLKMIADLVIFDGTPCNLVTDSIIISRYVDTTLIVSAYRMTKMDELENLKKSIENVGGKIAGVVINRTKISQKQYYSAYYYGGHEDKEKKEKDKEIENTQNTVEVKEQKEIKGIKENKVSANKVGKETKNVSKYTDNYEQIKIGTVKTVENETKTKNKKKKEEMLRKKEEVESKKDKKKAKELEDMINEKLAESKEEKK